jgi:beta-glucanase (GH16 family)
VKRIENLFPFFKKFPLTLPSYEIFMRYNFLFLFILPLFIPKSQAQCWNLVWEDEFTGTALNTSYWTHETGAGGWGNNELQNYANSTSNVNVSDGTLKINAIESGGNYTSGRIVTKNKAYFAYGKMVARLKLPFGQGIWPAFWMLPNDNYYGGWPYSGELDIMELLGHQPAKMYGTIHGSNAGNQVSSGTFYNLPSGTFADDFHEFSMEWEPNQVKMYVDGNLYMTRTNAQLNANPWPFDKAFFFIFNVAVGGNWPQYPDATTVFPQTMEVDWVRVYQKLDEVIINGQQLVENNAMAKTYSVTSLPACTYTWSVPSGASITSGQGTNVIQVNWGNSGGEVSVLLDNACGSSTRTLTVDVSPNIWANPAFEQDLAQWSFRKGGTAAATVSITTSNVQEGTKAANVSVTAAGANPWDVQLSRLANDIVPNEAYSLTFWVKSDASRLISFAFIHPSNYTWYAGGTFTSTSNWQEVTVNFTAPAGQTQLLFNADLGRFSGANYQFDNFVFGKSVLLPVELIDFNVQSRKNNALLHWTVSENQMSHYLLERSDGNQLIFNEIAKITAQGNVTKKSYQFEDRNLPNSTVFYRLSSVGLDGKQQKSDIIRFENKGFHIEIMPNPTVNTFQIKADFNIEYVEISDIKGAIIERRSGVKTSDLYSLESLPSGIYYVRIWVNKIDVAQIFTVEKI